MVDHLSRDIGIVREIEQLIAARLGPLDGPEFGSVMGVVELIMARAIVRASPHPDAVSSAVQLVIAHLCDFLDQGKGLLNA